MKLIVGLGNPGAEYEGTRHNVGFEVIDALSRRHSIKLDQRGARARFGRGIVSGETVLLIKPQTFMNLSGESVRLLLDRESLTPADVLVICDDIHLPVGRLRLRGKGSSGGQNGLKSIAAHLGTLDWPRLRLGVGEPPPGLQVDWVLSRFSGSDRKTIDESLIEAVGAVELWLEVGVESAMGRVNADPASRPA
jgi:PTH1 family peptidyl-tRNA hydrolase